MTAGPHVSANLVLAANGATTLGGRSAPLSSRGDRARFHALRAQADLILVGGSTARIEPYEKTPCRLLILSRGMDMGRAASNPLASATSTAIAELLPELRAQGRRVLIEAGVSLVHEAILAGEVDQLFITRTTLVGDGDFFNAELLKENFELSEEEIVGEDRYQIWKLRSAN